MQRGRGVPVHVTADQAAVVVPASAVHVAMPDPLYPAPQFTTAVWPVVPEVDPVWSLLATLRAPHEEAVIHH